jgi:transposase-like protein
MSKHRKSWNQQERMSIIQFANVNGVAKASTEFNVSSSIIYRWQKLVASPEDTSGDSELHRLKLKLREVERENASLKEIVADQTLALKIKDSIIKKKLLKDPS